MSAVELTVALAAFGAGWTGTWSPCGFSMIETIGPTGHRGGMPTTLAACASFLPGALLGGVITFGQLAMLGDLLHDGGGRSAYGAATLIAAVAALLELRGARIFPQVRRQLPEDWRRRMPMPLAAALYGVLLGLGFTTFVLTFGVWALAAISFALGQPHTGVLLGISYGLGRALPVVGLAPLAGRPLGIRATELMAERPMLYRGFRLCDAALLALLAAALATASSAVAAKVEINGGADPSVAPHALAWQAPDGTGFLLRDGGYTALPGRQPAVGGPYAALVAGDEIKLLNRYSLAEVGTVSAPGADGLAVSERWLAYRIGAAPATPLSPGRLPTPPIPAPRSGSRGPVALPRSAAPPWITPCWSSRATTTTSVASSSAASVPAAAARSWVRASPASSTRRSVGGGSSMCAAAAAATASWSDACAATAPGTRSTRGGARAARSGQAR